MKNKIVIAFFVSLIFLTGCRNTVPVFNIEEAAIVTSANNASSKDIVEAIITAGNSLGWAMTKSGSSEITGVLNIRQHMAKVSIKYTTGFYSIKYIDSNNLKYDGTSIHQNYNGWIKNLNNAIQSRLSLL